MSSGKRWLNTAQTSSVSPGWTTFFLIPSCQQNNLRGSTGASKLSTQWLKREFFQRHRHCQDNGRSSCLCGGDFLFVSVLLSIVPSCCRFILDCMESIGWSFGSTLTRVLVMGQLIGFVDLGIFLLRLRLCVCVINYIYPAVCGPNRS